MYFKKLVQKVEMGLKKKKKKDIWVPSSKNGSYQRLVSSDNTGSLLIICHVKLTY